MADNENNFRKSDLKRARDVLQKLFQATDSPLSEQFLRWKLWNQWADVVGKEIADHSMPVGYLSGTLYVWVKSAPRMQEMIFLVRQLRKKINDHVGKSWVRSIRFTLDRKEVPSQQENSQDLREYLSKQSPNANEEPPHDR